MVMLITATTSAAITAASRGCISNKASLVSFTSVSSRFNLAVCATNFVKRLPNYHFPPGKAIPASAIPILKGHRFA